MNHQAEGLPGLVCERPEPLQEAGVDRHGCYGACWILEARLHIQYYWINWFKSFSIIQWDLKPSCLPILHRTPLDHWLKLRYDAINKMIGMLAEEITVNKGRAAYAGKVTAYYRTD